MHNAMIECLYYSTRKRLCHSSTDNGMLVQKIKNFALMICLLFFAFGCKELAGPQDPYESLFFMRSGGGNKEFFVTTNVSTHEIFFKVVKYDFTDTNYTESVFINDDGALSELIYRILDNGETITGDFQQPADCTGTWVNVYAVASDKNMSEILNTRIRDQLMVLETIVENGR